MNPNTVLPRPDQVRGAFARSRVTMDLPPSLTSNAPPAARDVPAAPGSGPGADPLEGHTATNPATGQRIIRQNGRWVPLS